MKKLYAIAMAFVAMVVMLAMPAAHAVPLATQIAITSAHTTSGQATAPTVGQAASQIEDLTGKAGLITKDITVLRTAPPGANIANWTDAAVETLRNNGYNPRLVGFSSCKEAYVWKQAHPNEPILYASYTDYAVLDKMDPNHPAACGFETNEQTLVGIVGRWWNFICGHEGVNATIDHLADATPAKVGVWNYPISMGVAKQYINAISPSKSVIGFASGNQMMQAFVSNDLDYIILSSENLAKSLKGAQCFATTAPTSIAAEYMPDRVSYDTLENVPFPGFGIWPYFASENTDIEHLRDAFTNHPGGLLQKLSTTLVLETKSIPEQLADIESVAHGLKGKL